MNIVEKIKQWKKSVELDIDIFKYEFKDNLKSSLGDIFRVILTGLLTVPTCFYLLFKWILKVLLVILGIYLFFWMYGLFVKFGIYILGVLVIGWFFVTRR